MRTEFDNFLIYMFSSKIVSFILIGAFNKRSFVSENDFMSVVHLEESWSWSSWLSWTVSGYVLFWQQLQINFISALKNWQVLHNQIELTQPFILFILQSLCSTNSSINKVWKIGPSLPHFALYGVRSQAWGPGFSDVQSGEGFDNKAKSATKWKSQKKKYATNKPSQL